MYLKKYRFSKKVIQKLELKSYWQAKTLGLLLLLPACSTFICRGTRPITPSCALIYRHMYHLQTVILIKHNQTQKPISLTQLLHSSEAMRLPFTSLNNNFSPPKVKLLLNFPSLAPEPFSTIQPPLSFVQFHAILFRITVHSVHACSLGKTRACSYKHKAIVSPYS